MRIFYTLINLISLVSSSRNNMKTEGCLYRYIVHIHMLCIYDGRFYDYTEGRCGEGGV